MPFEFRNPSISSQYEKKALFRPDRKFIFNDIFCKYPASTHSWVPSGPQVGKPCGPHLGFTWVCTRDPNGSHLGFTWAPTWAPNGLFGPQMGYLGPKWATWAPLGIHLGSTWAPLGPHLGSKWAPSEQPTHVSFENFRYVLTINSNRLESLLTICN